MTNPTHSQDQDLRMALAELSSRATQGQWSLGASENGYRYVDGAGVLSKPGPDSNMKWRGFARFVVEMEDGMTCAGESNVRFIVALVNAYRSGQLHDATTLSQARADALAQGRREGLEEAADKLDEENDGYGGEPGNTLEFLAAKFRALATAPTETRESVPPAPWPAGCIKPNACARHKPCVYAMSVETCRHYGTDLTPALAALERGEEA